MSGGSKAVFLSYASEDSEAAQRIADALRAASIEVWFDKSELRGGDAWDQTIRQRIRDCRLFVPVISANSESRLEGYFRREWKLAADRTEDMASNVAFLVPVVIDDTPSGSAEVPERFRQVQWVRLPGGTVSSEFIGRIATLLGPEGPTRTATKSSAAIDSPPTSRPRSRRIVWPVVGIAALLLVIAGGWAGWHQAFKRVPTSIAPAVPSEKSIAVLPFVDMSEKHDQEYFGDGMAEEVLDLLEKIPGLKVIGRTSSFQFKGKADDLRKVGAALGAVYVVEGSVRRSGERMRITAQLIDTRDGAHRWSQTYDRDERDTIAVQDEIATGIVRALEVEVTSFPSRIRPKNDEAYEHYLRGLHAQDRFDEEGFNTAVAEFQHALGDDPAFAPAAEQLAMTKYFLAQWGFVPAAKGYAETLAAADAAIALDPLAAEAYNARATAELESTCNWRAAGRDLTTALKILPNSASILIGLAQQRIVIGQYTEALRILDAAVASDPLAASAYMIRAWAYLGSGRFAEAEIAERRALEIAPTYGWGHHYLAVAMIAGGKYEAALAELQMESVTSARDEGLVFVYQALHKTKDADAAFERFLSEREDSNLMGVAAAYTALGKRELAFEWLERARQEEDPDLCYLRRYPLFKALEGEPRYREFLRKLDLPQ